MPTGNIVMYVQLASSIQLYDYKYQNPKKHTIFITGVHNLNETTYIRPMGQIENLVIAFKPTGFYFIFGINAGKIKNRVVELQELIGDKADNLLADCRSAPSLEEKFKIIDRFLEDCLAINNFNDDTTKFDLLLSYISDRKGLVGLNQLSDEFALPSRTIERYFNKYIGITPKEYIDVIRFNFILDYLLKQDFVDWQEIIYSLGFYDQSHFIKSFKTVTGYTPNDFINDKGHHSMFLERFEIIWAVKDVLANIHVTN